MYRLMYNSDVRYVSNRDGVYYYTRRVPYDVKKHYASDRLYFSLKAKSYANAVRAAQQAVHASTSPFLFPRYCDGATTHSNSASAALNKWLRQVAGSDYVIHSFRHSMRDRLRGVNCPSDMINQIGGWSKQSIGETYGEGHQLEALCTYLIKTTVNF